MGGGVFGNREVESRLADTLSNAPSPDIPATACTPVGWGTDKETGTTANGGSPGLRSRKQGLVGEEKGDSVCTLEEV
jgi:hypothetical protein